MAVSESEKKQIIEEYEKEQRQKKLERRCKVKPLHDARLHYEKVLKQKGLWWKENDSYYERGFYKEINDGIWTALRNCACEKFDLEKITDLRPEDYDRVNEWGKNLIDDLFGKIRS